MIIFYICFIIKTRIGNITFYYLKAITTNKISHIIGIHKDIMYSVEQFGIFLLVTNLY